MPREKMNPKEFFIGPSLFLCMSVEIEISTFSLLWLKLNMYICKTSFSKHYPKYLVLAGTNNNRGYKNIFTHLRLPLPYILCFTQYLFHMRDSEGKHTEVRRMDSYCSIVRGR